MPADFFGQLGQQPTRGYFHKDLFAPSEQAHKDAIASHLKTVAWVVLKDAIASKKGQIGLSAPKRNTSIAYFQHYWLNIWCTLKML